jgi:zinc/manganese transport system substrate-binding protein/manganese/iron transport system substrate-binding protein
VKRRVALILLLIAAVPWAACSGDPEAGGAPQVVATTTQAADLARNVAGDRAEVTGLLPPNADPHGYEPRARDVKRLAEATLVVRSGGEVDEWLGEAQESAGGSAREVVLGEGTDEEPHWWQDPRAATAAVAKLKDALIEADPGGRAAYEANARRYRDRLEALDRETARCIRTIPAANRKLVTTHDALGAYAARYGLEVIATVIPSRSTRAQASAGETAELVRTIRRERVPAIFAESSVRSDVEEAIAREAGARVAPALYADSLGPEGSPGETYVGSIEANTRTIASALGGRCA